MLRVSFICNAFDAEKLAAVLSGKYQVENLEVGNNTINCFIEDVKVDFVIVHPFKK